MTIVDQNTHQSSLERKIQQKIVELAELVAQREFGADGPGKNVTFREIEEIGYQAAQRAAREFEVAATKQHQQHFQEEQACPQCGQAWPLLDVVDREILTRLGPVKLSELKFFCNACRRSFFPSA
ncbi:MAG: hypothetical protein KatS3mg111_2201 [Pirellulaceae bacterium]|nr:MAG: hypothetical protein KatS3mg111_2201 [Pirellulaceae bacterium]